MQNSSTDVQTITDQLSSWYTGFLKHLPNITIAVVVLVVAYFLSKYVNRITQKIFSKRIKQLAVLRLLGKFSSVLVVLGGLFIALNVLQLEDTVKAIIAGAGVSGLVVGLALQGTLSNTISGIHLSFRENVRIGDWIETNGYEGEVIAIDLNKFILREADNNTVILPNKLILEKPLKNYGLTKTMRVIINCGVGYDSDLSKVERVAKQAMVDEFDQVSELDDVEFYYRSFGDSSINFVLRFYFDITNGIQKLETTSTAIRVLKEAFTKENIDIPYPIRTLHFNDQLHLKESSGKGGFGFRPE